MQQDLATAKAAFALAETTLGNLASLLVAPASSQVAPPQQLDVVAEEDEVEVVDEALDCAVCMNEIATAPHDLRVDLGCC